MILLVKEHRRRDEKDQKQGIELSHDSSQTTKAFKLENFKMFK
jgi:hypothetical protein